MQSIWQIRRMVDRIKEECQPDAFTPYHAMLFNILSFFVTVVFNSSELALANADAINRLGQVIIYCWQVSIRVSGFRQQAQVFDNSWKVEFPWLPR